MTKCALKAACLPVTALRSVQVDGHALLLAGQGPYLHIYNAEGTQVLSTRVFDVQQVHGIWALVRDADKTFHHHSPVVVWGGSLLRFGWLTFEKDVARSVDAILHLRLAGRLRCPDWILDAVIQEHSIFMLTAHNQLLEVPFSPGSGENPPEFDKMLILNGPRSFLYSGCLSITEPNLVIVASGTVFGEILVWTCSRKANHRQWSTSLRHVFQGHEGSVFGVSVSEAFDLAGIQKRLLASCSDDRTVRIWDISDRDQKHHEALSGIKSSETGFGNTNEAGQAQIASVWGHLSRIWDVKFVQERTYNKNQGVLLLSRGEDAACQLWAAETLTTTEAAAGLSAALRPVSTDRHHFGKNAWSMSQLSDSHGLLVYTGGADGQIISRKFENMDATVLQPFTIVIPFREVTTSSLALKHYQLLGRDECLASTDQGHLFRLTLKDGKLQGRQLHETPVKGGLTLCAIYEQGLILIAHQRGGVFALLNGQSSLVPVSCELNHGISWMKLATQDSASLRPLTTCIVAVLTNKEAVTLWVTLKEGLVQMSQTTLRMPDTFNITASCYDQSSGVLFLGSRAGALAIYSRVTPDLSTFDDPYCLRHVHGTDSITSIRVLQQGPEAQDACRRTIHILTAGRDGNYAIYRLSWPSCMEVTRPLVSVLHLSAPPFGPNIEGAYFADLQSSLLTNQPDLILYGFRSTSFVVWNETLQCEILSIDCGGSHRSWSFKNYSTSSDDSTKSFVWTKAGKFNWHNSHGSNHKVIRQGGHGREIKAVARSTSSYIGFNNKHHRVLIATGAEDTNIRLFALSAMTGSADPSSISGQLQPAHDTAFHNVAVLKRHTTGIQHLQFSPSGRYLFGSAGCEEFYVWKLSFNVPCVGVGIVLWDVMPTEVEDSDARIMDFDLQCDSEKSSDDREEYIIVMAYSNGKAKVVRYTSSTTRNEGTFETLREVRYGSFCVMQAFFLPLCYTSPSRPAENQLRILSAGTNGFLNLSHHSADLPNSEVQPPMDVQKVHQSSILAMDTMSLGQSTHLIATGGDDNALGLTLLTSSPSPLLAPEDEINTSRRTYHPFRTILIPAAHAATLTALKIVGLKHESTHFSGLVITVGNDQRVKVWHVGISLRGALADSSEGAGDDRLFEAVQVKLVASAWTGVADVSGLEIVEDMHSGAGNRDGGIGESGCECKVLVVGVGMELLSVKCNIDENSEQTLEICGS